MMANSPHAEKQKQNPANQPQKTKKRSLFWSFGLGLVLVLILVVAVILNTAGGKQLIQFNQPNNAEISPTKSIQIKPSQITLTPEQSDSIGVLESSKYILKSEIKLTKYQVTDNLKLDPKQEIEITQKSDKEFLLKLKNVFDPGSVQKFSLNIEDTSNQNQTKELSWAFQTYQKFAVTKTIPESNTSDISTNSKIEVEFNTETFQSIENFWEISPPTKGKFVKIGNKINFIPEKLEPATIYTITIKKGLALEGSKQFLDNDFSWQFETQQDSQVAENRTYFNQEFYEFSQSVSPNITLGGKLGDKANLELYKFRDLGQFLEYLKTKQQLPNWTNYQDQKEKYDLKNLQKVLGESFGIEKTDTQNFVKFPAQLEKGFYLLHLPENQNSAILQSTDLTVNFTTDNNKILAWANNIQTQKPASIAQIKDINGEQLAVTDDSGLAFFDKPKPKNNEDRYQFYQVISDKEILIVSTTKTKQNSPLNETKNANYWSYLYLDKNTYKPSDKISFWGLAKSRTGEKIDSLKAVVYKIENQKTVLIQDQTISLSSLDTFLSSLNLQNLPEGNYQLNLQKNTENEIIINSNFRVQNPTPKNYQILLESNKKFYLKNEEIVISGKVNFKDQTPASQVSLNYSGDVNGEVVTDNFGNFSIKYPVSSIVQKSYQPIAHTSILVQLKNPQESDIKSSLKIPYFPYQIIISDQSKTDTSKGILDINLNSLDTFKYTSGLQNINNLKGNPIGSKDILAQITSYVFDKIETGQNYNPITKQTETQYSYTRRDKKQTETKVSTDNQGLARLEISFESETYYQINLQLTDSDNKNILFSRYFSTTTNSSPETTQNFQFIDQKAQNLSQKNYQPGEVVKLEIQKNGQTDIPQTNSNYLIIQSQNGIKKYSLQSKSQYEYNFTESGIPNINFSGVKFDGKNYSKISPEGYPVNFTKENQELKVEIFSNKSVYQSGENASVEFKISDLKNEPKKSKILVWVSPKTANGENLEINKSENIYSNLSTGINQNYNSHSDSTSPQKLTKSDLQNEPKKSEVIFFEEIESDQNGLAKANFNLPDSFDSWDILAKVVSSDLFFGSNLATIYTATDLQIASILSSDYLENDQPSIKLQTIGEKLDPKTEVEYTIEIPYLEFKKTQKGLASGVEVQLPKLKIGELELNLSVKNGEKQSKIQQIISVKSTNQKSITQQFTYPELSQKASLTNLPEDQTFQVVIGSAENIGYYTQLQKMANSDSGTLESLQISYLAKKLLTQYYDSTKKPNAPELDTFNKNGGFSNFPDSQKDIKFTTQVLESDLNNLTGTRSFNFFKAENSKVQENFEDRLWILFGLTLNQHNVLQQLQNLNQKTDLTLNQKLIISQALDYAGDKEKARQNYYQILQENSQVSDNSKYIKGDNLDQNLELTNQALGLANLLNEPDAKDLNEYLAKNNYSSFKQILYLQKTLKNLKTDKIIFSYQIDGQKKEVTVEYNKLFKINLNKKALEDLNLEIKTGEISLGLNYTLAFESNPNQPKITRIYQTENTPTNKFNKNDLVNVGLKIEFGNNLLDGCYKVSDQVPAGLKIMPEKITDSINQITPYQNDTKTINFCIYPNQTGLSTIKINYFAKAFSAGGFNVQSATIENLKSDSSLNLSPKQTVEIN